MGFLEKAIVLDTADTVIFECPIVQMGSMHGLVFANTSSQSNTISVKLFQKASNETVTIMNNKQVNANSEFTWPKPINLNVGDKVIASASAVDSIAAVASLYLTTDGQVLNVFAGRGEWASDAVYAKNEVVSLDGSSYVAIVANQNDSPPSASWMIIASKGAQGDTGPQGIQGETGPQGIQGDTGPQGETGVSFPSETGQNGNFLMTDGSTEFWGTTSQAHGFPDRTSTTMTYDSATRTLTLSQPGGVVYYYKGKKVTAAASISLQHSATRNPYFYLFDSTDGILKMQSTPWNLDNHIPTCEVFWDGSKGLAWEERHGHLRNIPMHKYLHNTHGTQLISGMIMSGYTLENGTADSNLQWTLTSGSVADEDITVVTSAISAGGPYLVMYRDSPSTWLYDTTATVPYRSGSTYIQYDNNGVATELAPGQYVNYWVYGASKLVAPHAFAIMGQAVHNTLDAALAETLTGLSFTGFAIKECVPIYKVTLKADSEFTTTGKTCIFYVEAIDISYRKSKQPVQYLDLINTKEPAAPPVNHLSFYAQSRGGRLIPHWIENNGLETAAQPALFGNNVIMWLPGTSSTAAINFGTSFTTLSNGNGANQSHPTLAPTNAVTQMKRAAFNTGSTSGGNSGVISTSTVAWRGNDTHLGGFFFFARLSLEAYAADERFFVGLSANTGAMNGVNPSAWNNTIGIGKDTADTQLYVLSRDTTATTKTATGIVPNPAQILDFQIFCKPNDNKITLRIFDPVAGVVLVDNLDVTTNLPQNNVFMYMQAQIESVTGSTSKMLSLNRMYLESDT